jgi:hypothetical protein
LPFVLQNLAASIVHVEVHFVPERKAFHQLPELLEVVEQLDPSPSIEVIGFDQPNVPSVVHFGAERELPRRDVLVLCFILEFALSRLVDLLQLLINVYLLRCQLDFFYEVEVLAEAVDLTGEALG